MPEKTEVKEMEAVANNKNFSTIPNSNSEFCVYTYKAEYETVNQIQRPGFFNPAYSFVNPGDAIRVFRFDPEGNLTNYLQFIVVKVDKINKKVAISALNNNNLENRLIGG